MNYLLLKFLFLFQEKQTTLDSPVESSVSDSSTTMNQLIVSKTTANIEINDEEQSKSSSISMKRIFATFLTSSSFQPLKLPFAEEEHFILNCESNYYVNEKDLSSIVAFTLRYVIA